MTSDQFTQYVKEKTSEHGVKVIFRNSKRVVVDGCKVTGWYSDDDKELVVARKYEDWLWILAHEFCHFNQWCEQAPVSFGDFNTFWEWLEGKDFPYHKVLESYRAVTDLEYDAESRTITLIKNLELPINILEYTKACNSYLFYYNVVLKHRKWFDSYSEEDTRKVLRTSMPRRLSRRYQNPPEKRWPQWLPK